MTKDSRAPAISSSSAQGFQACPDGTLRLLQRARVVAEVVREVRAEEERVELERELRGIDVVGRDVLRPAPSGWPAPARRSSRPSAGGRVAHGAGAAVELERRGGEEAAAGKDAAADVGKPGVADGHAGADSRAAPAAPAVKISAM